MISLLQIFHISPSLGEGKICLSFQFAFNLIAPNDLLWWSPSFLLVSPSVAGTPLFWAVRAEWWSDVVRRVAPCRSIHLCPRSQPALPMGQSAEVVIGLWTCSSRTPVEKMKEVWYASGRERSSNRILVKTRHWWHQETDRALRHKQHCTVWLPMDSSTSLVSEFTFCCG